MPAYSYVCECEHVETRYMPMSQAGLQQLCSKCERAMERDWGKVRFRWGNHGIPVEGYVTQEFGEKPIRVQNIRQERDLCQRHGMARVTKDDVQFGKKRAPVEPLKESFEETFHRVKHEMGVEL